ncbi:ribonuclease E/G [Aquibacillus sp. 3ASR75-11]|uniref:Ribonuclease E/G n=1 Tax=Terrihalobacillus insolitus TaxID=2950438 RepID=A0A9X3WRB7_9BACI|nr:ribonuclease E/G [Terrihalobacillus insolitus]MDC3423885.1 ribonuclease E/G [Terrihalobacillus insolitus]
MRSLYIHSRTTEQVGVVMEQNDIREVFLDRPTANSLVGNIYVGRVRNIEKGLQAAFVDVGLDRLGFLQLRELPKGRQNPTYSIENVITEGEKILVQIIKDPFGEKGAMLTANITIPGVNLVFLPFGAYIAASKKLPETSRTPIVNQLKAIKQGEEGAIVRTSAPESALTEIESEYGLLKQRWQQIVSVAKQVTTPTRLFEDHLIPDKLLRRFSPSSIEVVYVDDSSLANDLRKRHPVLSKRIKWKKETEALLPYTIPQLYEYLVRKKVQVSGGANLHIDQAEALTVIDVNSSSFTKHLSKNQTMIRTNMNAAIEAAKQIRLRNLSGMIIIDFIRMSTEGDREKVRYTLEQELAKDPVRTEVYGFTKLGLLEMTRKRETPDLPYLLLGSQANAIHPFSHETTAYILEREIVSYQMKQVEVLIIELHPNVYERFLHNIRDNMKDVTLDVYMIQNEYIDSFQVKHAGSQSVIEQQVKETSYPIDKVF